MRVAAADGMPAAGRTGDLVVTNGKSSRSTTASRKRRRSPFAAIASSRLASATTSSATWDRTPQVIDAGGQLVIPGFIEGHGHFTGVGEAQLVLKLTTAKTWDDIVAMVENAAKTAKPGQWIYGRGWHQEKWTAPPTPNVEGFPTQASLSRVSPNNPVLLTHASGHASFANAMAMELSGDHAQRRGTRRAARF